MSSPSPPKPKKINPYEGMDADPLFAEGQKALGIPKVNKPKEVRKINEWIENKRYEETYKDEYFNDALSDIAGESLDYTDRQSFKKYQRSQGMNSKQIERMDRQMTKKYGTGDWHLQHQEFSPSSQQLDQINARAYDYKLQDETNAANEAMMSQQQEWAEQAQQMAQDQSDSQSEMWQSMMDQQADDLKGQNKDLRIQNRKDARAVKLLNNKTLRVNARQLNRQEEAADRQLRKATVAQQVSDRQNTKALRQQTKSQTRASNQAAKIAAQAQNQATKAATRSSNQAIKAANTNARQAAKQATADSEAAAATQAEQMRILTENQAAALADAQTASDEQLAAMQETSATNAQTAADAQAELLAEMQANFDTSQTAAATAQQEAMEAMMNQPIYKARQQSVPTVQKPVAKQAQLMPAPVAPSPMSIAPPPAPTMVEANNSMAIVRTSAKTKRRQRRATRGTSRLTN